MRLRLRAAAERPPVVAGSLSARAAAVRFGVVGPFVPGSGQVEVEVEVEGEGEVEMEVEVPRPAAGTHAA